MKNKILRYDWIAKMWFQKFFYSKAYITIIDYLDHSRIRIKSPKVVWIQCLTRPKRTGPLLRTHIRLCREEGWSSFRQSSGGNTEREEIWFPLFRDTWKGVLMPRRGAPKITHSKKERAPSFFWSRTPFTPHSFLRWFSLNFVAQILDGYQL